MGLRFTDSLAVMTDRLFLCGVISTYSHQNPGIR